MRAKKRYLTSTPKRTERLECRVSKQLLEALDSFKYPERYNPHHCTQDIAPLQFHTKADLIEAAVELLAASYLKPEYSVIADKVYKGYA